MSSKDKHEHEQELDLRIDKISRSFIVMEKKTMELEWFIRSFYRDYMRFILI